MPDLPAAETQPVFWCGKQKEVSSYCYDLLDKKYKKV